MTATWSALSGSFDQAAGLKARWRPAAGQGLEAVTLTVADPGGGQSQAVARLLIDQGRNLPGQLAGLRHGQGRWTDPADLCRYPSLSPVAVTPPQVAEPSVIVPTGAQVNPSPAGTAASVAPYGSASPALASPGPSGSPTSPAASNSPASASASPGSGSPSPSGSPVSYATTPPSGTPNGQPTAGSSADAGPTPSPNFTPYNPLATPTPQTTPHPASTS